MLILYNNIASVPQNTENFRKRGRIESVICEGKISCSPSKNMSSIFLFHTTICQMLPIQQYAPVSYSQFGGERDHLYKLNTRDLKFAHYFGASSWMWWVEFSSMLFGCVYCNEYLVISEKKLPCKFTLATTWWNSEFDLIT